MHHARLPAVRIRPTQLVQLFQNLVGDAIKFHKPGTSPLVRIEARRVEAEWIFSVRENGIGIEREYGERIFQIFQRLHGREEYARSGGGRVGALVDCWMRPSPDGSPRTPRAGG